MSGCGVILYKRTVVSAFTVTALVVCLTSWDERAFHSRLPSFCLVLCE